MTWAYAKHGDHWTLDDAGRVPDDLWVRAEFVGDEVMPLPMVGAQAGLDGIYDGVELPPLAVAGSGG